MLGLPRDASQAKNGDAAPDFRIAGLAAPVRHALRALTALARENSEVRVAELARRLDLPAAGLSKYFQRLARSGILSGRRGRGGGYSLAAAPESLTLEAVADALGGLDAEGGRCVMEDRLCGDGRRCLMHAAAAQANRVMRQELRRLTLADLAGEKR
jgi:Rrf2 family protein